ncbi:hypothetical protein HMPREF9248_0260 [Fannyhessea vaginae PB189-T1-4]|uniref:Uncharacterized protein n=1 Tax=Fannyhessea vaginae PB189-T1-4 TaxID=866774 RepID=A0ABP2IYM1_9ACTN|nr:hypothetical protein HMPREF9248_0260 [Fannyhessea vaginae PB189-T1-4]
MDACAWVVTYAAYRKTQVHVITYRPDVRQAVHQKTPTDMRLREFYVTMYSCKAQLRCAKI